MRIGAALVAAVALSSGAAGCGSGSSTDSTQSSSDVPKKEAGIGRDVSLSVVNQSQDTVTVDLCSNGDNCRTSGLRTGESSSLVADQVTGSIRYQNGDRVNFEADSPTVGRPVIRLSSSGSSGSSQTLNLDEDESQPVNLDGHSFAVSRSVDTENKELRLVVSG